VGSININARAYTFGNVDDVESNSFTLPIAICPYDKAVCIFAVDFDILNDLSRIFYRGFLKLYMEETFDRSCGPVFAIFREFYSHDVSQYRCHPKLKICIHQSVVKLKNWIELRFAEKLVTC
jgi:hypothetical protein